MFKARIPAIALMSLTLFQLGCATGQSDAPRNFGMGQAKPNNFWWPEQLDLKPLRQHSATSTPASARVNYAREFRKLDIEKVRKDVADVLTNSQDWWPADWGNYGPFMIRLSWHAAGTYRIADGRGGADGGQQRFDPLNSWPDNANLDKARRLLLPIKQKYGNALSWSDLLVLAGTVAMDTMGFETLGFAGGRIDEWEADLVYWGPETKMGDDKRHDKKTGKALGPVAASQMGLIYVNPEGPNGNPDPLLAAKAIRETFGNMAMNDEETVALIAGGHTFGKAHGARKGKCVGAEPAAAGIEEQGFGWKNKCGTGKGPDTITSGLEGAWTANPTAWTTQYLDNLFNFEWVQSKSPRGLIQWVPKNAEENKIVPDAYDPNKSHAPIMFTTDLALKFDPAYREISLRFKENPEQFEEAFAKAWFKLTHRDMGPKTRYLGKLVPKETFIWQDPIPAVNHKLVTDQHVNQLKSEILKSGLTVQELVRTAWASASTYRGSDMRGGANGARIRLAPQKDWSVNNPAEIAKVLAKLEKIQKDFNRAQTDSVRISLADMIVLGGNAAIEKAARDAGVRTTVEFRAGRMDASQAQTDAASFAPLEPKADAFRNYYTSESYLPPLEAMVDKAALLNLSIPEMTVLVGGMRVLGANADNSQHGIFTSKPGALSNDFFINLIDMSTAWSKSETEGLYEGRDRKSGELKWTATPVDLIFGSHAELRAVAEHYGSNNAKRMFVTDFVAAWNKVMNADRF